MADGFVFVYLYSTWTVTISEVKETWYRLKVIQPRLVLGSMSLFIERATWPSCTSVKSLPMNANCHCGLHMENKLNLKNTCNNM